ncbi:MAG TPA: SigE family RNA polymerase sigma factor [Candidatus Limnocylindrales bacterium]
MTTTTVTERRSDDFEGFYLAHFADIASLAYGLTADASEAEDIAQEAFCRAWQRWARLSGYDNPVLWVRRVAINLAHSRWRRLRVAAVHAMRGRVETARPADAEHVAVVAALRKLPADQREAIVLHHMMDLPVAEVARMLRVPAGTVKSWLHRGRDTLAFELDVDAVVRRGRRRRLARNAVSAVVLVLLLTGLVVGVRLVRPPVQPVVTPPVPPSPSAVALPPEAVRLTDQGTAVELSWVDTSGGAAQPIVIGARSGEGMRRFAIPQRGATGATIVGLSLKHDYCFRVVLVYTDEVTLESGTVCTDRTS